jgi:nitroreductase
MTDTATDALDAIRRVRQTRRYTPDPIDPAALDEILAIVRWTGSSANIQPWRFVVVDDPDVLRQLAAVRDAIGWVATAPLAIAIVLNGDKKISEAYDEGRVTERIMIAAKLLGLGSAVAWYGDASQQAQAKAILGAPEEATARSLVAIGHPDATRPQRSGTGGRKPLDELVSRNRLGARR